MNIWNIATHLTGHHRFNGYNQTMKDEMISDAYIKVVRNLKNLNLDKGTAFNYITRCCFTAFVVYLRDHYKELNFRRKLIVEALESAKGDGRIEDTEFIEMLKRELEEYDDGDCEGEGVSL